MRILLTNDDGYFAEGLTKLALALCNEHDVVVSAPATEKSGAGHSLTFNRSLHFNTIGENELLLLSESGVAVPVHAVHGSPADAVKFAIEHIYADKPFDLVISGVNSVLNIGTDIIYSGTFGAAEEGSVLGVKSIAVSAVAKRGGYDLAIEFVKNNLPKLVESIPPFVTLNVNVPCGFREEIKGVRAVPLGLRRYNDWYERDGKGGYELFGAPLDCSDCEKDTDCKMSDLSYITLTPVPVFTTDEEALKAYAAKEWKL